jgi:hypothetical protein
MAPHTWGLQRAGLSEGRFLAGAVVAQCGVAKSNDAEADCLGTTFASVV